MSQTPTAAGYSFNWGNWNAGCRLPLLQSCCVVPLPPQPGLKHQWRLAGRQWWFSLPQKNVCGGSLGKCQSGGVGRGRGFGGSAGTPGQQRGGGVTPRAEPAAPSGTALLWWWVSLPSPQPSLLGAARAGLGRSRSERERSSPLYIQGLSLVILPLLGLSYRSVTAAHAQ